MFPRVARWVVLGACTAAGALGACNQVLGIEDAAVDPRLSGSGAASSSGGTAGKPASGSNATGGSASEAAGGRDGQPSTPGDAGQDGTSSPGAGGDPGEGSGKPATAGSNSHGQGSGGTSHGQGSAGKSTGGEAGAPVMMPVDPCDEYCDQMDAACTDDAAQYRDRAQCERICHLLPAGAGDDDTSDSVSCRLRYLKKTEYTSGAEVTNYCRQAGPSGEGACGTVCDAFCSIMMQVCTEDSAGEYHFASEADCLTTCNALPPTNLHYSSNDPLVSDGNTALCRLFHVNSAAMADPEEHCEHAMGMVLCTASD